MFTRLLVYFLLIGGIALNGVLSPCWGIEKERQHITEIFKSFTSARPLVHKPLLPSPLEDTTSVTVIINDTGNDGPDWHAHTLAFTKLSSPQIHITNLYAQDIRAQILQVFKQELTSKENIFIAAGAGVCLQDVNSVKERKAKREVFLQDNPLWPEEIFGVPFTSNPSPSKATPENYQGFYQWHRESADRVFGKAKVDSFIFPPYSHLKIIEKVIQQYRGKCVLDLILLSPFHGVSDILKTHGCFVRSILIQGGPLSSQGVNWGYNTAVAPQLTQQIFKQISTLKIPTLVFTSSACDQCLVEEEKLISFLQTPPEKLNKAGQLVQQSSLDWNLHMSLKRKKPHIDLKLSYALTVACLLDQYYIGNVIRTSVKIHFESPFSLFHQQANLFDIKTDKEEESSLFFVTTLLETASLQKSVWQDLLLSYQKTFSKL